MAGSMTAVDFARLDFELTALRAYLRNSFGAGGELRIERVGGGQSNPTYFVDYGGRRMVLRKKPAGSILPGAHAIEREFRVLKALGQTDVPIPKVILLCEDSNVLGTPFYLMERLEGRSFHDCSLPAMSSAERRSIYLSLAETMARLHAVNPYDIGLGDFGRPGNYFERQISRWSKQYAESPSDRIPALEHVVAWLPKNLPPDDGRVSIAHGDFRLGNMLFHPSKAEVVGILDWELATLGHPLADLAFCCIPWHSTFDEYGGILGLDHPALGIPSEAEFVTHYFKCAMPTSPLLAFHIVFALFRFAVIFLGISDRAKSGTASSSNAAEVGLLATKFAARAEQVIASKWAGFLL
jgi:aminoglycoside phosphotransferase (APT) family kinase protein